ncbi:protein translocase subunit SecF [Desulfovibrio litoralis]|uniref:Protein-export membrane protein SecF n=1 Tax=Desulfovibrio litoralis DSM 11393 TaxID=1121455 RepID=A0A1M7SNL7_9BACT|nr:protein translocase subunit SecF [Desulfovibrio litoralis]SHN60024.1 protein translocase subunit secF [Desulfovibrio litoralis DSM 11393]
MKFFSLVPNNLNIDFVRLRRISYFISGFILLIGIISLVYNGGLRYGIDFAGGAIAQVKLDKSVDAEAIKAALKGSAPEGFTVQSFGAKEDNTWLIRIPSFQNEDSNKVRQNITNAFASKFADAHPILERLEVVGPKVGADLRAKALEAMFYSILFMAVYISGRFEQKWAIAALLTVSLSAVLYILAQFNVSISWLVLFALLITIGLCVKLRLTFALGAIVSILHDILITVGLLSILGVEFDLTTIAALLTLVGYSLNDTIIVFDRIRENIRENTYNKVKLNLEEIINKSVNQTLSRTILTSATTLLVLSALLIYGGSLIFDFALVMFMGVFIGTASSIFVASPVLLALGTATVLPDENENNKPVVYEDGSQV